MARPKKAANVSGGNSAKQEVKKEVLKEQIENGGTRNEETPEAKEAKSEEKVSSSDSVSSENLGDEKTELEILKEKNAKLEEELAKKDEKVVEVKVESSEKKVLRPSAQRSNMHDVIVKGKVRPMTKQSYEAISKDPKLNVSLPKGSTLVEPILNKPCEDC